MSYEFRVWKGPGWNTTFSPRWLYDFYSDRYNNGLDGGSWPDQALEPVPTIGVPRLKQFPYTSVPNRVDNPFPTVNDAGQLLAPLAAQHRFAVADHHIGGYALGQGQALIDGIKAAIAQKHPVMVGFPVWPEYDNSQGLVDLPSAAEIAAQPGGRGGHENVVLKYNDSYFVPAANGYPATRGAVLFQNQWSSKWSAPLGGRSWVSYRFVAQYVFGAEYLTVGPNASGPHAGPPTPQVPHIIGSQAPTHHAPAIYGPPQAGYGVSRYVSRYAPYYRIVNAASDRYHVGAVGLEALLGTESNFQANAERFNGYWDSSCGLAQVALPTARDYGVTGSDLQVCRWEENPHNGIWLAARVLQDFNRYACYPGWPRLDFAYNAGPFLGCAAYYNPSSANYSAYLSWWYLVLNRWQY